MVCTVQPLFNYYSIPIHRSLFLNSTSLPPMTSVYMYVLTTRASPGIKDKFVDELLDVLDCISPNDILVVLGDFDVHVGNWEADSDVWRKCKGDTELRGPTRLGKSCWNYVWSTASPS